MRILARAALVGTAFLVLPAPLLAQAHVPASTGAQHLFALIELPALLAAVVFGFLTARALHGGRLGAGMKLVAWGFLVMAVGHVHMQVEVLFGLNLFGSILGADIGLAAWILALLLTWTLTGLGFLRLYHASARV